MNDKPPAEQILAGVADGVSEVVVLLNSGGSICQVLSDSQNPAFFDTDLARLAEQTLWDVFSEARAQRFHAVIEKCLKDDHPQPLNCQRDTEDGVRHFRGELKPVGGDNAEHAIWIAEDATPQRRQEQQQKTLDRVFEVSPLGLVLIEPSGDISRANERAADILGSNRDTITSRTYHHSEWQITHDDGTPISDDEHPVTRTLETGEPVIGFEHWIELPDGSKRWLSSHSAPVLDEENQVQRVVVGLDDSTQQKEREQRLKWLLESEQLADIGGWEIDCETAVVEGTAGMSSLHGKDEYRLPLSDALEMYHPDDRERLETALMTCREEGTPFDIEGRRQTVEGRERWVRVKAERIERQGKTKIRGVTRDITISKEREQRLKVMNRVLRHNIKNRLNIILGHAQLVQTELETLDIPNNVQQIGQDVLGPLNTPPAKSQDTSQQTHLLAGLLSDLSEFSVDNAKASVSQIETASEELTALANKVRLLDDAIDNSSNTSTVDVGAIIADLKREYSELYPTSSITIEDTDIELVGNPEAVRLIIAIPVENALEHNNAPEPAVSITVSQPTDNQVAISVEDNGPGIPTVEKDILYGAGETPTAHSSGFGLWMMQWLLRRLGGEVAVSTADVDGTRLELTLPTTPADRETVVSPYPE